jgi:hypothetical protein
MRTLYDAWQAYLAEHPTHTTAQRDELKHAFYGGAAAVFNLIELAEDTDDVSAINAARRYEHEVTDFHRHQVGR